MKNIKALSLIIVVVLFTFSACEKISPPYKEKSADITTGKKVLLEDYTGHTCVNCPTAARTAHLLKEYYGENLIVMAVHAGYFANPHPGLFENDYRTEAGNEWNTYFGFQQYPNGMVDRVPNSPGDYIIAKDKWGAKIDDELKKEQEADITIENTLSGNSVTINISVEFLKSMESSYNLFVGITEDSIISAQKNENPEIGETPIIEDYVFMHMFRGAVNGTWGENIFGDGAIEVGNKYTKTYQYTLTGDPNNSHVVAYVYDTDTKTIIQAEEENVK